MKIKITLYVNLAIISLIMNSKILQAGVKRGKTAG
jgi:hypothetical protein